MAWAMRGHALEVDDARVGAGAGHEEPRADLGRLPLEGVVVDAPVGLADAVGMDLEEAAAEVERVPVGQVAAVGQAHAQDAVAVLEHREVGRHVGLGARVGLDVDELGAREDGQGALLGEALHDVDVLAAAVVALARLALGVLVGEPRAVGLEDRARGVVLAGDELDLPGLPLALGEHRRPELGVDDGDGLAGPAAVEGDAHSCSAALPLRVGQCTRVPRAPARAVARPATGWSGAAQRRPRCGTLARAPSRSTLIGAVTVDGDDARGDAAAHRAVVEDERERGAELLDELARGAGLGLAGAVGGADRERPELAGERSWHGVIGDAHGQRVAAAGQERRAGAPACDSGSTSVRARARSARPVGARPASG